MITAGECFFRALQGRCPRCLEGKVFSGVYKMNSACPYCCLKFEKEPGYFSGVIWLGYYLHLLTIFPLYIILIFKEVSLLYVVVLPTLLLLGVSPFTVRLPKALLLHFGYRANKAAFERNS